MQAPFATLDRQVVLSDWRDDRRPCQMLELFQAEIVSMQLFTIWPIMRLRRILMKAGSGLQLQPH